MKFLLLFLLSLLGLFSLAAATDDRKCEKCRNWSRQCEQSDECTGLGLGDCFKKCACKVANEHRECVDYCKYQCLTEFTKTDGRVESTATGW